MSFGSSAGLMLWLNTRYFNYINEFENSAQSRQGKISTLVFFWNRNRAFLIMDISNIF